MFIDEDRLPRTYHPQSTLSHLSHTNGVLITSLQAVLQSCASIYALRPCSHRFPIYSLLTATSTSSNMITSFLFHSHTSSFNINLSHAPFQILDLPFADLRRPVISRPRWKQAGLRKSPRSRYRAQAFYFSIPLLRLHTLRNTDHFHNVRSLESNYTPTIAHQAPS